MKKLYLIFALIIGTALIGCTSEDPEVEKVDYYIKYYVKSVASYQYIKSVSVTTDKGFQTYELRNKVGWEQTYGPVAKGFKASIHVDGYTSTVEIHCCRGKEPFALKAIKNGQTNSPSLEYTIDY
jgi:hypothetical protein